MLNRDTAELERTRANSVQVGTVAAVESPRVRVKLGDLTTAPLDVLQRRAGPDVTWWMPEVGEQVAVICPDGDPAMGIVIGGLYSGAYPAPSNSPDVHRVKYSDGAIVEYDRAAHKLKATLPGGGTADVIAPGGATITAPLTRIVGNLEITGTITMGTSGAGGAIGTIYGSLQQIGGNFATTGNVESDGDQIAGGISQITHVHGNVQPGSGNTGAPVG
jgi:phage baseplate assembly protein V